LFASGCSPPRFTATQLPSAIGDEHSPKEDFHLFDRTRSRAHGFLVKPGMTKKLCNVSTVQQIAGKVRNVFTYLRTLDFLAI
ncbi:MAG: hypothetical protein ABFD50_19975, partial [Smithella sp.]